ncbi:MAG: sodium:calcium antiporter [Bacteroidetes bacterium]|nr:MAG: sodium:calcium antiporter [Bacteroidota bacterium]
MEYIHLILGLIILYFSGKYLLNGGVALASHLKISTLVVGVTVVAFGTSAPEFFVSLDAALKGFPEIAIGNVIGSDIANVALVLGFAAILLPIPVRKKSVPIDWAVMMFSGLLLYLFIYLNDNLNTIEGIIFLVLLTIFLYLTIHKSRKENKIENEEIHKPEISLTKSIILIIISSVGLYFGAEWLIKGAVKVAENLGVSQRIIAVTVIAFGTSVPELATALIAAVRKQTDISIGTIIGSNIIDILGVLGMTSIIKNINISFKIMEYDFYWMFAISMVLLLCLLPINRTVLTRFKGFILLLVYIVYIYFVIIG